MFRCQIATTNEAKQGILESLYKQHTFQKQFAGDQATSLHFPVMPSTYR